MERSSIGHWPGQSKVESNRFESISSRRSVRFDLISTVSFVRLASTARFVGIQKKAK